MPDGHVEEQFTEVDGGRVFVRRWFPAVLSNSPPVVLLHDSLGCVELWRDFPAQLAQALGREVIAYDRLGYGRSTALSELPSLKFIDEEAATTFPAICRDLGLEQVVLFGHSVGGGMAIAIASIHSKSGLCSCVITESAQAFVEERTKDGIRKAKEYFRDPSHLEKLTKYHGKKAQWVLDAWTESWLDPKFESWSLQPHLSNVTCPVLAIHGDKDEYGSCAFPRLITDSVQGHSQAVVLEGFGHVPHREDSVAVLDTVANFLSEVENSIGRVETHVSADAVERRDDATTKTSDETSRSSESGITKNQ